MINRIRFRSIVEVKIEDLKMKIVLECIMSYGFTNIIPIN